MVGRRICNCIASAVLAAAIVAPAVAQQPGGQGRGRGGGGFGGFGGRGGGQVSAANVPVEALAKPLSLTADQKTKIEAIQTKNREALRALMPQGGFGGGRGGGAPGGPGAPGGGNRGTGRPGAPGAPGAPGGAPGGPGGPGGGRGFGGMDPAVMEKIRGMSQKAGAEVEAVLNSSQKAKLPGLLKEFQALRGARIPLEVASDLKLTADQVKRIEAVSDDQRKKMQASLQGGGQGGDRNARMEQFRAMRQETQTKVDAILTADQKATIKKYEDAHPRQGRGGPGGGGGGRRGGRGGGGGAPPPII